MRVIVKKRGNSASVRIPAAIMSAAKVRLGQAVDIREERGRIVIDPVHSPKFDLDGLIAEITNENRHSEGAVSDGEDASVGIRMKTTRFDAAEYLDTPERQAEYISAALETCDAASVRDAVGVVARARGRGDIARASGLNRESLYRALGETGNPEFGTTLGVLRALGLELAARPVKRKPARQKVRKVKVA